MVFGMDAARHCLPFQRVHHVGDVDLARTLDRAGVAGGAQPDGQAVQHLVAEALAGHRDDPPRREVHVVAQRAGGAAGAALDAAQQFLSVRLFGHGLAEREVQLGFELDPPGDPAVLLGGDGGEWDDRWNAHGSTSVNDALGPGNGCGNGSSGLSRPAAETRKRGRAPPRTGRSQRGSDRTPACLPSGRSRGE